MIELTTYMDELKLRKPLLAIGSTGFKKTRPPSVAIMLIPLNLSGPTKSYFIAYQIFKQLL